MGKKAWQVAALFGTSTERFMRCLLPTLVTIECRWTIDADVEIACWWSNGLTCSDTTECSSGLSVVRFICRNRVSVIPLFLGTRSGRGIWVK